MARLVFCKGEQRRFLIEVEKSLGLNSDKLADVVEISGRSFRDWINEKTLGVKEKMLKLSIVSGIKLPEIIEEREEWWSGRVNGRSGAIARMKIYGPPGNYLGRSKGGTNSQIKRKENPDYYRALGCPIPRSFHLPTRSSQLAEFFGTVLGDGGIRKYQMTITLNSDVDKRYIRYVIKRSIQLFGYSPYAFKIKNCKAVCLLYTGINLIQFFTDNGLKVGDKKKLQVDVPNWIKENLSHSIRCVRGLMDTDGGAFIHKYIVNGKQYKYLKICFTNMSQPLLRFVYDTLKSLGLTPKYSSTNKVWLYDQHEVQKYFEIVGSSNFRLLSKLSML